MRNVLGRAKAAYQARREAWPWFDHLVRAAERYKGDGGDRLAAALTMYSILALLPLLLLAMSILGYVMANDPVAQQKVLSKLIRVLPGIGAQLDTALENVEANRGTLGLVGIGGLLFSGLGGITALRDALRLMWHQNIDMGSFFKKKGYDALTLVILVVALTVSFGVSALATGGAGALLEGAGVGGPALKVVLYVLSFAAGVFVDAVLFLVLFKWLPRVTWPWQRLVRGAIFGGFLFGLVKIVGGWYVARTATKSTALYGSIGTAVALLVGLYIVSRVILYAAAWTVTAPGWHDVEPSGTASPEAAREAGIPVEEARGGESYNGGTSPPDTNVPGRTPGADRARERRERAGAAAASSRPSSSELSSTSSKDAEWDRKGDPAHEASSRTAVAAATGFGATLLAAKALKSLRRD